MVGREVAVSSPHDRAQRTRETLVASAAREIDRHGFDGTSLTAILAGSGVTKGAFYFHFPSKDQLAAVIVADMTAALSPVLAEWARRDVDALRLLLGLAQDVVDALAGDTTVRAGVRIVAERGRAGAGPSRPLQDWTRIAAGLLGRAQRDGVLRPGVDPGEAADVVVGAVLGQRYLAEQLDGPPLRARFRTTCELLLPALACDEWLAGWWRGGWASLDAAAGPGAEPGLTTAS
ncbi:ScbR family autoregulator-binding transcription factor [Rhodococcus aerolatus]